MGCLTRGRKTNCTLKCSGGVNRVFVACRTDVDSVTVDPTTGKVTGITMVAGAEFYEIESAPDSVEFKEDVTVQNCSKVVTRTLEMLWRCRNCEDREAIDELAECCCGLVVIHQENTEQLWLWDVDTDSTSKAAYLRTANSTTGKAFGDQNATTVTIGANSNNLAVCVDMAISALPIAA